MLARESDWKRRLIILIRFGFHHNVVVPANPDIDEKMLAEAEEKLKTDDADTNWRVLTRLAGPVYSHATLVELIAKLEAAGIEATHDNIASSGADMGLTNFVLKVREPVSIGPRTPGPIPMVRKLSRSSDILDIGTNKFPQKICQILNWHETMIFAKRKRVPQI